MDLNISRQETNGRVNLIIEGEIDLYTVDNFKNSLQQEFDSGQFRLIIDLIEVSFIDSSGIAMLIWAAKKTNENGGEIFILSTNSNVDSIFSITGLGMLMPVLRSYSEIPGAAGAQL